MQPFRFDILDNLLKEKYKAKLINKFMFRDLVFGEIGADLTDVKDITEGIIGSDHALFYLIDDVRVINDNCKCLYPYMYPSGKVFPEQIDHFCPYILFAVELSEDGKNVVSYGRWGSFADNIFEEMDKLGLI